MSEPADYTPTEEPLPGLEPRKRGESALQLATRRTIAALSTSGLATETHAMLCQLLLDLAETVDAGRRQGKASAAAMAAAQMTAAYLVINPPETGGGGEQGDAFDELAGELRCASGLCDHPGHPAMV